jgi:hypothetical protein
MSDIIEVKNYQLYEDANKIYNCYNEKDISQYLTQNIAEPYDKYEWRKKTSYFKNFLSQSIKEIVDVIFSKPYQLTNNSNKPKTLNNYELDLISQLNFRELFSYYILLDNVFILLYYNNGRINLKYFNISDLINYRVKGGKFEFVVFKKEEFIKVDKYKDELKEVYYLIEDNRISILDDGGKVLKSVKTTKKIDELLFYPNQYQIETDFQRLPFLNMTNLNLKHYNLASNLYNVIHIASNPIPVVYGTPLNNSNIQRIGVNNLIFFSDRAREGITWSEIDGKNIDIGLKELANIEKYINDSNPTLKYNTGSSTITTIEVKLKFIQLDGYVTPYIKSFENMINKIFNTAKMYNNKIKMKFSINNNIVIETNDIIKNLIDFYKGGGMSSNTALEIISRLYELDIDIPNELEKIKDEIEKGDL